jgi:hypothetical protein
VARYQVLLWADLPSLVKAFADDGTAISRQLDPWFQQEIDREAMRLGLTGSDAYLEQWHWAEAEERAGTPEEVLDAVELELAAAFADCRTRRT